MFVEDQRESIEPRSPRPDDAPVAAATEHAQSAWRSDDNFVGRADELVALRAALDAASAGHGRLVLVGGEPGIGKTRLVREVTAQAEAAGIEVRWGRAWEDEGAPAFWPWVQVLRS